VVGEGGQPRAQVRRPQRARTLFKFAGRFEVAVTGRALGGDALAQRGQVVERGARGLDFAALARFVVAQFAQRVVLVGALRADEFAQRLVEAFDRADRGVFLRAAVERLRERRRNGVGTLAVERDRALADASGLQEHLERDLQVRVAGVECLAVADARGDVVAAAVKHAQPLAVAVEGAMHFPRRTVAGFVGEDRGIFGLGPGPPAFFFAALQAVERGDDRRS
jgi:hypothetical protein